jgi:hypothetical protein
MKKEETSRFFNPRDYDLLKRFVLSSRKHCFIAPKSPTATAINQMEKGAINFLITPSVSIQISDD